MKAKQFVAAFALVAGFGLGGSVYAACTLDSTASAAGTFTGNSCTKNTGLTSFCAGGNVTNGAGTSVVQVNVGNAANLNLKVVSATTGFNPELAFISGTCASLTGCTVDDTNNGQTVPASGTDTPSTQPAAGTSFVLIGDLNTENPGCGDYTLTIGGTVPVKIQSFSVE